MLRVPRIPWRLTATATLTWGHRAAADLEAGDRGFAEQHDVLLSAIIFIVKYA
jgi:hypothetical protein